MHARGRPASSPLRHYCPDSRRFHTRSSCVRVPMAMIAFHSLHHLGRKPHLAPATLIERPGRHRPCGNGQRDPRRDPFHQRRRFAPVLPTCSLGILPAHPCVFRITGRGDKHRHGALRKSPSIAVNVMTLHPSCIVAPGSTTTPPRSSRLPPPKPMTALLFSAFTVTNPASLLAKVPIELIRIRHESVARYPPRLGLLRTQAPAGTD